MTEESVTKENWFRRAMNATGGWVQSFAKKHWLPLLALSLPLVLALIMAIMFVPAVLQALLVTAAAYYAPGWIRKFFKTHPKSTIAFTLVLIPVFVLLLQYLPVLIQPALVWILAHALFIVAFGSIFGLLFALLYHYVVRHRTWTHQLAAGVVALAITAVTVLYGLDWHDYFSLYSRYQSLPIEYLDQMPVTGHERVQPWLSVKVTADSRTGTSLAASDPALVRDGSDWRFTLAFEPNLIYTEGLFPWWGGKVEEIHSIPATGGGLDFGPQSRADVSFDVGDNLMLAHNTHTCMVRSFEWSGRYLNYEPATPVYMKDDSGAWVTVIPLIRWEWGSLLFPRPEFGGVEVIPQQGDSGLRGLFRWIFGCGGYWVRPEEIGNHPFLVGQDLMPEKVSHYMAESFRFSAGFTTPLTHVNDVRIPDMPGNEREQPYKAFFIRDVSRDGKIYHYYALEPYLAPGDTTKKDTLIYSVFIPADGIGSVLVYDHAKKKENISGPSGIEASVRSQFNQVDTTANRPVENRPFVHDICGARRTMFITTMVTLDRDTKTVAPGSVPHISITNAANSAQVYSVDPKNSEQWEADVARQMCGRH